MDEITKDKLNNWENLRKQAAEQEEVTNDNIIYFNSYKNRDENEITEIKESNNNIINFDDYKQIKKESIKGDSFPKASNQNLTGKILNSYKKIIKKKYPTKEEADDFITKMEDKKNNELATVNENTNLMTLPNEVTDIIKIDKDKKNELLVQEKEETLPTVINDKPKSLVLYKKVGSIFTSVILTIVVLTIGMIAAIILMSMK